MIDIQELRKNPDFFAKKAKDKGYDDSVVAKILQTDQQKRDLKSRADDLRAERNLNTEKIKSAGGKPDADLIENGKRLKEELAQIENDLKTIEAEYDNLIWQIPNPSFDDVPLGGEEDSVEVEKWGETKTGAEDHLDFAKKRGWVDFERGAKVAGAKFYYLKGDLALLENALVQFGLNFLTEKGFTYMTVPNMVNSKIATGTGFAPRSSDQSDEYFIEGEDLSLIATAEIPLTGYHAGEIIDEKDLPFFYAGYSPCYRKEAGTYGKHTRGLFRVHQFNKLEMYAYSTPEESKKIHQKLLETERELWQKLKIPYHVVNIAAGDLGAPAAKKFDIEYWSPVDGKYRELTSCSNCTDFQARNLNIRVRRQNGEVGVLHTLNGTAVSLARSLVAVIENYQKEDGKLEIPEVLQPFMGGRAEI